MINSTGTHLVCPWYWVGKPSGADLYTREFIDEMKVLLDVGHRNVRETLDAFVNNTPVREFLIPISFVNHYKIVVLSFNRFFLCLYQTV